MPATWQVIGLDTALRLPRVQQPTKPLYGQALHLRQCASHNRLHIPKLSQLLDPAVLESLPRTAEAMFLKVGFASSHASLITHSSAAIACVVAPVKSVFGRLDRSTSASLISLLAVLRPASDRASITVLIVNWKVSVPRVTTLPLTICHPKPFSTKKSFSSSSNAVWRTLPFSSSYSSRRRSPMARKIRSAMS